MRSIVDGNTARTTRPEYRGGIGDEGVAVLRAFVNEGGTLITLGAASDFGIEKFPVLVRNLKSGFARDQHFAPARILRIQVDTQHPIGYGMAADTYPRRRLRVAASDRRRALSEHGRRMRRGGCGERT